MRLRIGDICEIKTSLGYAYMLFTHKHNEPPKYGALIRIIDGIYSTRPNDLQLLAESSVQFTTFFPLGSAVSKGMVQVIGNIIIPEKLKSFPLFRVAGLVNQVTKKVEKWSLWDGVRFSQIKFLTSEQRMLPILGVWNYTMLVNRIEKGWRSQDDKR